MPEYEDVLKFKFGRELSEEEKKEVIEAIELETMVMKPRCLTDFDWDKERTD